MIDRVRWFAIGGLTKVSLEQIGQRILDARYSPNGKRGFVPDTIRTDHISATYVEKLQIQETIIDPFGRKTEFSRTRYKKIAFSLYHKTSLLELRDSPRGTRELFNQLSQFSDRQITIVPLHISVVDWLNRLEAMVGKVKVVSMALADIVLSESSSARLVVKGTDDVRAEVQAVAGNRSHSIEKLEASWRGPKEYCQCELHHIGRADLISGDESGLLAVLRRTIPDKTST